MHIYEILGTGQAFDQYREHLWAKYYRLFWERPPRANWKSLYPQAKSHPEAMVLDQQIRAGLHPHAGRELARRSRMAVEALAPELAYTTVKAWVQRKTGRNLTPIQGQAAPRPISPPSSTGTSGSNTPSAGPMPPVKENRASAKEKKQRPKDQAYSAPTQIRVEELGRVGITRYPREYVDRVLGVMGLPELHQVRVHPATEDGTPLPLSPDGWKAYQLRLSGRLYRTLQGVFGHPDFRRADREVQKQGVRRIVRRAREAEHAAVQAALHSPQALERYVAETAPGRGPHALYAARWPFARA